MFTAPIWLAAASFIHGVRAGSGTDTGGMGWFILAGVIASFNAYLSFLRPWLYARGHEGSTDGFRRASGIPLVGTLAVTAGIISSWGHTHSAILGAVLSVADSGGAPVFLVVIWRDKSFWGEQSA